MPPLEYDKRKWKVRLTMDREMCDHLAYPGIHYWCLEIDDHCNKDKCPHVQSQYKEGYEILMEYWSSLPDEEKEEINERLENLGL